MAGLLVYLPDYNGGDNAELTKRGVGDLFDSFVMPIFRPVLSGGPDGGTGTLVAFDNPSRPGSSTVQHVEMDQQKWLEAPALGELDAGRYWLGYWNKQKPRPEDLQRHSIADGLEVLLADDRRWIIPVAHFLPTRLSRTREGLETQLPLAKHCDFVEDSNALFQHFISDGFQESVASELSVTIPNGLAYAAAALAKNYRVNVDAVDLLELIDSQMVFEIAQVATGLKLMEESVKKNKVGA
ncbi:MAG: hypothetical protein O7D91_21410 [Planctomycetota bacterium]|nr:hypothetical protein [Planctomycetota bacterium]